MSKMFLTLMLTIGFTNTARAEVPMDFGMGIIGVRAFSGGHRIIGDGPLFKFFRNRFHR